MTFLQEYDALQTAGVDAQTVAQRQAQLLGTWMFTRLHELLKELREHRPIFQSPTSVLVTKNRDVREVLARDDVFAVTYAPIIQRLLGGPFILGMPNSPQYERELSILRLASSRDDLERIRVFAAHAAERLVREAIPAGRIDVVGGLARRVPARLVAHYFGVPGPDEATLMGWMRTQFWEIFVNLTRDPDVQAAADKDAAEISKYLDQLIASRKQALAAGPKPGSGPAAPTDMLSRLIQMQDDPATAMSDADIRRNISGVIIGAVDTTNKSIAHAIDQLIRRPEQLQAAQTAAREDNDALVSRYVFEAMRFNPQNDFLYRVAQRPFVLAQGTDRETQIPAGSFVLASTTSAMFDEEAIVEPDEFRIDRDPRDYLFYGHQLHTCFGQYINDVQIPQICKPLLKLPGLRRAGGDASQIRYQGPFPDAFWLEFDQVHEPVTSVTLGGNITELTLITPIKEGQTEQLAATLTAIQHADVSPIQRISTIHYARWVIIDNGTRLLFTSNFDGSWEQYLGDFAVKMPEGLDMIWGHCVGWPGSNPFEPFAQWVRDHQQKTNCFYAAYPSTTVPQVTKALDWQKKTQKFLGELAKPPGM